MQVLNRMAFVAKKPDQANRRITEPYMGKKVSALQRIKNITKEVIPVALGIMGLEAVILFSFSSIDGLFFIISTLASGTSIYVLHQ